ncbi:MAG: hypothetical protein WAL61_13745, partial [Acidimicrobiales bacterium]
MHESATVGQRQAGPGAGDGRRLLGARSQSVQRLGGRARRRRMKRGCHASRGARREGRLDRADGLCGIDRADGGA